MRRIIPVSRRNTTGTQRRRSQSKRRQVRSFYFTTGAGKRIESKEDGSLTVMCQVGGNESLETYVHDTLPRTMSPWHVPLSRGLIIYQPITGLSTITHIIILDTTKVLQYPVATPGLFDSKYNRFLIPRVGTTECVKVTPDSRVDKLGLEHPEPVWALFAHQNAHRQQLRNYPWINWCPPNRLSTNEVSLSSERSLTTGGVYYWRHRRLSFHGTNWWVSYPVRRSPCS